MHPPRPKPLSHVWVLDLARLAALPLNGQLPIN
jgi:hypothetical protein